MYGVFSSETKPTLKYYIWGTFIVEMEVKYDHRLKKSVLNKEGSFSEII
jgi:hypothetical protein